MKSLFTQRLMPRPQLNHIVGNEPKRFECGKAIYDKFLKDLYIKVMPKA